MISDGISCDEKNKILRLIRAVTTDDIQVYLYGSRARGKFTNASDIDLALKAESRLDFKIVGEIKSILNEGSFLPYSFDVVDLDAISESFREIILKDAILWK